MRTFGIEWCTAAFCSSMRPCKYIFIPNERASGIGMIDTESYLPRHAITILSTGSAEAESWQEHIGGKDLPQI